MKTLILSTKTGQGHNSASFALKASLEEAGGEAVVADVLKSSKKDASAPVSSLYNNMVMHAPAAFGMLYRAGELVSSNSHHSPIYYLNSLYADRLFTGVAKIAPQVVVCPHIFSAQAMTRLREKKGLNIPTLGIVTDYTCSPFWEETRLNAYVIPAAPLVDEFVKKGVPRERIYPLGIPVHPRFKRRNTKQEARAAFGVTGARFVIAVIGGSMGYGCIPEIIQNAARLLPEAQILAVCGNNKKLYQSLLGRNNVTPFEYINNMDLLMDASDVVVTKPGGLSSTEAMVKRVPVVLTSPIPGGEERNATFLSSIGTAIYARTPKDAANAAAWLAQDAERCAQMTDAQKKYINSRADDEIAALIAELAYVKRGDTVCCNALL